MTVHLIDPGSTSCHGPRMARPARMVVPHVPHQVTQRGNGRRQTSSVPMIMRSFPISSAARAGPPASRSGLCACAQSRPSDPRCRETRAAERAISEPLLDADADVGLLPDRLRRAATTRPAARQCGSRRIGRGHAWPPDRAGRADQRRSRRTAIGTKCTVAVISCLINTILACVSNFA